MFCNELKTLAQLAGINATDRHLTVFRQLAPNINLRPDISLPGMGQGGSTLLIDAAFTDARGSANAPTAATTPKAALRKVIQYKERKYLQLCHQIGHSFMVAAVEISGMMADDLLSLIKTLVGRAALRSGIPEHTLRPYWYKRLSMVVQRGNARFWLGATTRMAGPDVLRDESIENATHHVRNMVSIANL